MSHKVKNPIPAKELTMADVTTVEYQGWKAVFESFRKAFSHVTMQRLKAITFTKDVYVPTKVKEWQDVEVVIRPATVHTHHKGEEIWTEEVRPAITKIVRKKVTVGEGILREHNEGDVTIREEYSSRKIVHPAHD